MKKINRKGFTIVELVIVIAVIAILSAVLIPTFSNLIRKANISSDTVLGRNLNTALNVYEVENGVDSFEDVLDTLKENGYLIANLNAKADGCFFVWEKETNQILLVDGKDGYNVLFSVKDGYGEPDESWYFAISNKNVAEKVETDLAGKNVQIKKTIANISDLEEVLNADSDQVIYIDESIVISDNNPLLIDNESANITINLVNSLISSNGTLKNVNPIEITNGNVTINGGIIAASGSFIDADGDLAQNSIVTKKGTKVVIDGSTFNNTTDNGYALFAGEALIKNSTFTVESTESLGVYSQSGGYVVLENTNITAVARCVWVSNYNGNDHITENSKLIIKSGNYKGGQLNGLEKNAAPLSVYTGEIIVEGGTFQSNSGKFFSVISSGSIVVKGGTFGTQNFAEMNDVSDWTSLCAGNYSVNIEGTGESKVVTITR